MTSTTTTVERVLGGDVRAAARLMREVDDRSPAARAALKALHPHTGRGYIVGITGNPGAGKSTVVDGLIAHYRARGERVGVVAVDPTSPFSGGAILGDRIRMQRHATDDGVFIRSLATRGHLGGLSRSTFDVVAVLDAMGYQRILVETVGVGQDEVDVMKAAHTSVVVTVPGLGDDIQAIKAGILEIADVLVVNKADREGADRTERDLMHMLDLRADGERKEVEILRTIANRGTATARAWPSWPRRSSATAPRRGPATAARRRATARAAAQVAELVRAPPGRSRRGGAGRARRAARAWPARWSRRGAPIHGRWPKRSRPGRCRHAHLPSRCRGASITARSSGLAGAGAGMVRWGLCSPVRLP
jgi:LAO/AO transport system kinase